jgi:hypothetical protein
MSREEVRLCCKNSKRNVMGVKPHLLFSIGCYSKQAGDERHLTHDVPFSHATYLTRPPHVHGFIALQGSPRRLQRKEAHPWFDQPFDET